MDQCANVSICQPVCTHGATDWHISRMMLFIVLFRFSHRRLLSCVKRVGYLRKSLYKSGRNETGSRIRICYRFQWFAFWCAAGLPGFLPVSFPVSIRIRGFRTCFWRVGGRSWLCNLPDVQILPHFSPCCNFVSRSIGSSPYKYWSGRRNSLIEVADRNW